MCPQVSSALTLQSNISGLCRCLRVPEGATLSLSGRHPEVSVGIRVVVDSGGTIVKKDYGAFALTEGIEMSGVMQVAGGTVVVAAGSSCNGTMAVVGAAAVRILGTMGRSGVVVVEDDASLRLAGPPETTFSPSLNVSGGSLGVYVSGSMLLSGDVYVGVKGVAAIFGSAANIVTFNARVRLLPPRGRVVLVFHTPLIGSRNCRCGAPEDWN